MRRLANSYQFSGGIQGVAGAVTGFLSNTPPSMNGTSSGALRYPVVGHRTARRLSVNVTTNGFAGTTTVTVFKDGVATALTLPIASGVTGLRTVNADVPFSDAGMDVRITCPNTGLLNRFECSAIVSLD